MDRLKTSTLRWGKDAGFALQSGISIVKFQLQNRQNC